MPTPPPSRSTPVDPRPGDGRGSRSPAPDWGDRTDVRTSSRYTGPPTSHQGYDEGWGERSGGARDGTRRGPLVRVTVGATVGPVQPRTGQVAERVGVPQADRGDPLHQQRDHRDHDEDRVRAETETQASA